MLSLDHLCHCKLIRAVRSTVADSDEVVQLYLKQPNAKSPAPSVRLADFARVHIKAGQTASVQLSFTAKDQALVAGSTGAQGLGLTQPAAALVPALVPALELVPALALVLVLVWLHYAMIRV